MILYPNAKINIGLSVGAKRADGYHPIDSVFYPVYALHDILEVTQAPDASEPFTLIEKGLKVDCPIEKNLVYQCFRLFHATFPDQIGQVSVTLTKCIPFGAGLGGGSADAAFMAVALNELFRLGLSRSELAALVLSLGADCPFFIYNVPCHATGIGEVLEPIELSLHGKYIVMIKPQLNINTKQAYAALDSRHINSFSPFCVSGQTNDFESPVFDQFPVLAEIKNALLNAGAYYASMSGSGSTVYGLFETDAEGRSLADLSGLQSQFAAMIIFHDTLR